MQEELVFDPAIQSEILKLQSHAALEPPGGYTTWVNLPSAVAATNHQFVMNSPWKTPDASTLDRSKIHAKVAVGSVWAHILGLYVQLPVRQLPVGQGCVS